MEGTKPGPKVYVVPEIMASLASAEKVSPSTVTGVGIDRPMIPEGPKVSVL